MRARKLSGFLFFFTCYIAHGAIAPSLHAKALPKAGNSAQEDDLSPSRPVVPEIGLAAAMKSRLTGLDLEPKPHPQFKKQANTFIQYRRGKMSNDRKLQWVSDCLADPKKEDVYCHFIVESDVARVQASVQPSTEEPESPKEEKLRDVFKIAKLLSDADLDAVETVPETHFHRALRLFPNWEPLEAVRKKALEGDGCGSPALLTALGQKAEEFFPEEKYRDTAIALYEKASKCADDAATSKARFRLSLLYIWANQCKKADAILKPLVDRKDPEFGSRALYWRAHCAHLAGNKLLAKSLQGKMTKEYPFSYHGLLLKPVRKSQAARVLSVKDPLVRFRSQKNPDLNRKVQAAEMLLELNANDLAMEILNSVEDQLAETEAAFRLYLALLYKRMGETIGQFKLLAGVFRDRPELISKSTLRLFYPLRRFDVVKRYASNKKVDPYLVVALIRQESAFNERARSPAGALGLMQLMPGTARRLERVSNRQLMNPTTNVRLGVRYFSGLLNRYEFDAELALAAYNAGPEKVDEWMKRYPLKDRMLFFDLIPYRETRDYVALISRNYYWYLNLYSTSPFEKKGKNSKRRPASSSKKPLVFTLFDTI